MPLKDPQLSVQERARLITRLKDDMPGATQADIDALIVWAENIRVNAAVLDLIESGELLVAVSKGDVIYTKKDD